jgi:hypothetical protein
LQQNFKKKNLFLGTQYRNTSNLRGNNSQIFTIYGNQQPSNIEDDLPKYCDVVICDPPSYFEAVEKDRNEKF